MDGVDVKKVIEMLISGDTDSILEYMQIDGSSEEASDEFEIKFGNLIGNMSNSDSTYILNMMSNDKGEICNNIIYNMAPYLKKENIRNILENTNQYGLHKDTIILLVESTRDSEYISRFIEEKREEYNLDARQIFELIKSTGDPEYINKCIEEKREEYNLDARQIFQLIKSTGDIEYIKRCVEEKRDEYNLESWHIFQLIKSTGDVDYIKTCIEQKREEYNIDSKHITALIVSAGEPEYIEMCILNGEQYGLELSHQITLIRETKWDFIVESELQANDIEDKTDNVENKKDKIIIPYDYAMLLSNIGTFEKFCQESDFRFFKSEVPQINDMTKHMSEEERTSFYKFASAIGCFSGDKITDKQGRETESILAQKSSSLLAKLLKTKSMQMR